MNGRRMRRGDFSVVSLTDLRHRRDNGEPIEYVEKTTVREVIADARDLHADPAAAGATFQVASQFNMLEMTSPKITPEAGVARYELDPTQGPACAVACGAGAIHRNYFVPFDGGGHLVRGQTADRQLDGFADLAAALGLVVDMRASRPPGCPAGTWLLPSGGMWPCRCSLSVGPPRTITEAQKRDSRASNACATFTRRSRASAQSAADPDIRSVTVPRNRHRLEF